MEKQLGAIWRFLHSKDWITWVGHGLLAFGGTWLFGWRFMAGWFVGRELSDLAGWFFADKETRRPFREAMKDGFFDLWAALVGAALAEVLKAAL